MLLVVRHKTQWLDTRSLVWYNVVILMPYRWLSGYNVACEVLCCLPDWVFVFIIRHNVADLMWYYLSLHICTKIVLNAQILLWHPSSNTSKITQHMENSLNLSCVEMFQKCCSKVSKMMFMLPLQLQCTALTTKRSGFELTMMTSSNGNIFRDTDPLSGEFTGHQWKPFTKASDAERWYFLWSAPE